MDYANQSTPRGRPVSSTDAAKANDTFEHFITAGTLKTILGSYQNICDLLHLTPNVFPVFYPKLKANLNSWKAKALWKKFDARANHKCYARGKSCPNTRVLIIGAGPCGLRTAIEVQLLGAKVVVIEKRDRMSRNNVLHLWPFVIEDLRALGAKKFFGKFCAGAIDHISIRQLQCILLKVALLLGVEVHTEVSFEKLIEPSSTDRIGWRAEFKPIDHPVSQYEFDVIVGADGKRNTLQGFKRKEFRGKLAIAITANFINKRTEAEARVEEISGVAFIFNQKFFKELNAETGIDLENIVYYKDDTHYFVMTAKKPSLIDKGVIKQDYSDTARLLAPDNVDRDNLMEYAREAAEFSTNYQMLNLEFAVNHYGQPDVAMFDFTSMYAAENASKVIERHSYKLLMILVGDSLLEPFWPTGSGCARGFLSSLDACWAIKAWGSGLVTPLEVLAERESIYRLLAQTTPENLNKDCKAYTVDPSTRYPNLNRAVLMPQQVLSLYDTDDPNNIELRSKTPQPITNNESHRKRRRRDMHLDPNTLISWIREQIKEYEELNIEDITTSFRDGRILCAIIHHYRPDLVDYSAIKPEDVARNNQIAFDLLEKEIGIPPVMTGEDMAKVEVPDYLTMFSYLTQIYDIFRGEIPHVKHPKLDLPEGKDSSRASKGSGNVNVLATNTTSSSINRITNRPKRQAEIFLNKPLIVPERKNKKRRSIEKYEANLDHENRAPSQSKSGCADEELATRIKMLEDKWRGPVPTEKRPKDLRRAIGKIQTSDWNIKEIEKKIIENKMGKSVNKEKERVPKWNKEQFLARQTKLEKHHLKRQNSAEAKYLELDKSIKHLDQRLKEGSIRDLGKKKIATITEKFVPKSIETVVPLQKNNAKPVVIPPTNSRSEYCHFCQKRVYLMERLSAEGRFFHRGCFKCQYCQTVLRLGSYLFDRDGQFGHRFYCLQHYGMLGELHSYQAEPKITKDNIKPLENLKFVPLGVDSVDLLYRVETPERIEFANLSAGHISSDHDESLSQIDEDEWTDRNFGASTAEMCSSNEDDDSSSLSESESIDDDAYEEALDEPPTKEGTLRWVERYKQRYSKKHAEDSDSENYSSSSDRSYYENSSEDEEDEPATEGEEDIRARELRKQEVCVEPPVVQTDTGSDTEIVSDDSSPESSSKHNSATEISTDSEFAVDEPTPTREIPSIVFNDFNVTKSRGNYGPPKKVQVKSGILQSPINGKVQTQGIQLEFTPLVPSPVLPQPALTSLLDKTKGYALNRTQSTGGIATKVSLELKKKYLLGDADVPGSIQKSGSVSTLDLKFKSFHTNISDCQKLLKPSMEVSPNALNKSKECKSPLSPLTSRSLSNVTSFKAPDLVSETLSPSKQQIPVIDLTVSPEQDDTVMKNTENLPKILNQDLKNSSPVQEIPIIVPKIDWNQTNKDKDSDISSDSLTTFDSDVENKSGIKKSPTVKIFENIPRVEIHDDSGEILLNDNIALDSLCFPSTNDFQTVIPTSSVTDVPKSITSEKKSLNQPKLLPNLPKKNAVYDEPKYFNTVEQKQVSGQSTPSEHDSFMEHTTALTETELSDWAHDSTVSDDFEDVEFELNPCFVSKNKLAKGVKNPKHANIEEFEEIGHVCGKTKPNSFTENLNNLLSSIEFMDTGEEGSSDEKLMEEVCLKNNGYVEFHNEDDIAEDSLNPVINIVVEAVNPEIQHNLQLNDLSSYERNTGYCIIGNEDLDLKLNVTQDFKKKPNLCETEEDSLLVVETGTTTEENTCSDVTVKNVEIKETENIDYNKQEYEEHCERLQSKIEFGNVRDSIDIRKSKRKEKDSLSKPDLIQDSCVNVVSVPVVKSPKDIYSKEEIKKVRDENQRLVQEIVMNKMKAQNRSLERKKRNRNSFSPSLSPNRHLNINKAPVADNPSQNEFVLQKSQTVSTISELNTNNKQHPKYFTKKLSIHSSFQMKTKPNKIRISLSDASLKDSETFSLPDITRALKNTNFSMPKQDTADNKAKRIGKENEHIDIFIQDNIESLPNNGLHYSNDTLKKKHNSFKRSKSGSFEHCTSENKFLYPNRTKSVSEISKPLTEVNISESVTQKLQFCKSDPDLLTTSGKNKKMKTKSFGKFFSEIFSKKKDGHKISINGSSPSKGFFSRISPKSKSKSMINLSGKDADKPREAIARPNSFPGFQSRQIENISPPPIPPPPKNYPGTSSHYVVDSSDGEHDWKHQDPSSCEILDISSIHEGRRVSKTARKLARQAQIKRHRMAQEIQRKLEETEVKARDLEQKGVQVEKTLRGEVNDGQNSKEEPELLQEWFNLMRDLIEVRRYERELMVRAQELELEDRHARLQQELRERLDNEEHKSKDDIKAESSIINEMMEVVAKRDSLIALLEQDRLRYSEEDHDFQEQVLAKGLKLMPVHNSNK